MSEYKTIGDYAEAFSGFAFSSGDLVDEGVPVIKIGNIQNGEVIQECDSFYQKEITENLKRYILDSNDFLIAMTGAGSVGRAGKMRGVIETVYLVNQRVAIVRTRDNVNPNYLFYFFSLPYVERYLYSLGIGAGQPNISAKDIMKIKVTFPDKKIQNKIADILVTYDELIDCNNKRIKILEQMAENLYKEWFVRFRFPGHEDAEFENGIPKGWEIHRLGEISDFAYGKMPSQEHLLEDEEGYPIFSGYRVNGYYDSYMYEDSKLVLIARGVGGTGDVAKSPPKSYITNLSIIFNLKNETLLKEYLYQRFKIQNLRYLDTGAAQSQITIDNLRRVKVIIPTEHILCDYKKINNSISCEMRIINQKNENLIRQRDLLLPRLMSGKLEIK